MSENITNQQPPQGQPQPQQPPQGTPQQPAYFSQQVPQSGCRPQPAPGPVYVQAAPAPKKRGWIVALVAVILFFALMFFGLSSCTSVMMSSMGSLSSSSSGSVDSLAQDAVGVITIDGTIQYDGTTASPEGFKEQLDKAAENSHIKAIVLRVNSGGGTATAGEEMTTYLREFMETSNKPVVVSCASMCASAAYEISSQADYIYVAKSSAVGAIGTAMQITDVSDLLDKLGISIDNITSADSKDSSYGTRALTEEERAYYQNMVDEINGVFIESVAAGRNMTVDEVSALATGLSFTGMDAIDNGLADEVGTLEDAIDKACTLAGISECISVNLAPDSSYDLSSLFGMSTDEYASAVVDELLEELNSDGNIS